MKKNGLKRVLVILAVLLLVGATVVGVMFATGSAPKEKEDVSLKIAATNLSFSDSVYIKYAVDRKGVADEDVKLLIWTEVPNNGYVWGSQTAVLTPVTAEEVKDANGNVIGEFLIFNYSDLAAKQMTDVVYARAYAEVDEKEYYSEPKKYSILQYAYNKLGKTGTASENEELKTLLEDMLNYGAFAQTYKGYKTDKLATADFYQVKLVGGTFSDGFNHGLYLQNDKLTVSAPETNDGYTFVGWKDSTGTIISDSLTCEITVGENNEVYAAVYQGDTSDNLYYSLNPDGITYSVSGIGKCKDINIVIPSVVNGKLVTGIADAAFKNCSNIKSLTISKEITSIGEDALNGCTSLNAIYFDGSEYEWSKVSKGVNWNANAGEFKVYFATGDDDWELGGVPLG